MEQINLQQVFNDNKDFIYLCSELDVFLNNAIGGENKREKYKKYNYLDTMDVVVVAYYEGVAVGCGALRKFTDNEIELKRLFVKKEYRGKNIGGLILEQLISMAKDLKYKKVLLETGEFLKESVKLYNRFGFEKIDNYGAYKDMTESICMALLLDEDIVIYCVGKCLNESELRQLFESVGWLSAIYANRMVKALRNAGLVVSAWKNNKLIGLTEVLDDGELIAYVHYLLVNPEYQGQGIGGRLLEIVREKYRNYLYISVISEHKDTVAFYEKSNFTKSEDAVALHIVNNN